MNKKEVIYQNIVANAVILVVLITLTIVGFNGNVASVFSVSKVEAYYRGNAEKKNISLMINVYWGEEYIKDFLSLLSKYNSKATFFIGGCYAVKYPQMLTDIFESGNELANHGYYHKDCKTLSKEGIQEEIMAAHTLVKNITSYEMTLFAPPSGSLNQLTIDVADTLGYKTIMWSKDTIDWKDKNSDIVYKRAIKTPKNGDMILMHPSLHTLATFESILKFYTQNGYSIVTVSENIKVS